MVNSPRVMIVSAFGRGHWLSVELQRMGFNVQLVDVTPHLGKTKPEDQDGPFGFFSSPRWHGLESESLNSLGETTEVSQGLTLWLKSGPWELRGPTSRYRAEVLGQQERVWHFIEHHNDLDTDRRAWSEKLQDLDFERRWLASFASDLMSNKSQWPNEAFQKSIPSGIFDKYCSRNPENRNLEASLKWCAEQGVVVVENGEIPDVAIEHRRIQGVEINADKSGFARCHQLIWLLTSMETAHFSPRAFLKLYEGKKIEPEWLWIRYRVEFEDSRELQELPQEFALIEDLNVPWAHDNFAMFRKAKQPRTYQVWLRLPYSQRFHREYLEARIQPVLNYLQQRCVRLKATILDLPPEAAGSLEELGAPLFPVFRESDLAQPPGISIKNLWFSHPERWPCYSWGPIYSAQTKIIHQLRQWWGELSEEQKQKELQL